MVHILAGEFIPAAALKDNIFGIVPGDSRDSRRDSEVSALSDAFLFFPVSLSNENYNSSTIAGSLVPLGGFPASCNQPPFRGLVGVVAPVLVIYRELLRINASQCLVGVLEKATSNRILSRAPMRERRS